MGTAAYLAATRKRRELMREWVLPLHEALALPLRLPEQTDPRRYLHIPQGFSEDDAVIRVDVPGRLDFSKDLVVDIIATKLALEGVTFSWHLAGRETYVTVKKTRKPPAKAAFKDPKVRETVAAAKESAPVIGIGSAGRIVTVDLDAESPHILVNASTGGGKSVTLRCIACQMLHHGSLVFVLDTKRISHPWASGLPGVTYCRDIADIHDQLIALGIEGRRRIRVADDLGIDADPKDIGPRLLILLEEVNATMKQLARYWEKARESGDPKTSPAVDALNEILYMGRQLRMHVLLVAQSATARALGGPEVREQFSTRILARYSVNAWRMLAPEVHPVPKSTKHHGRAQVVSGGSARETQILFFTEAEAREWATTGKPAPPAVGAQPGPVQLQKPPADSLTDAWSTPTPELPPDRGALADAGSLTPAPAPAADPGGPTDQTPPPPTGPGRRRPSGGAPRGRRPPPERHHPGRAALRPRQRPRLPARRRQARRRAPLPRRRPQEVGPQPPPCRHRHHRPGLTAVGGGSEIRPATHRSGPVRFPRNDPPALENTRFTRHYTEKEHRTMNKTALPTTSSASVKALVRACRRTASRTRCSPASCSLALITPPLPWPPISIPVRRVW
ncbi:pRL2-11 [Streptomyces sp. GKU 257-1]|nr:pRL2-11 [Streptomyces sp. GKU 257-1]